MKKQKYLLMLLTFISGGILFYSCEKDRDELKSAIHEAEITGNSLTASLTAVFADYYDDVCNDVCIDPEDPVYYVRTASETVTWGGPNNDRFEKTVKLKYYNTETHFVIGFESTHSPQNFFLDPEYDEDGEIVSDPDIEAPQGSEGNWFYHEYELNNGWQACDLVEHSLVIEGSGPPADG